MVTVVLQNGCSLILEFISTQNPRNSDFLIRQKLGFYNQYYFTVHTWERASEANILFFLQNWDYLLLIVQENRQSRCSGTEKFWKAFKECDYLFVRYDHFISRQQMD